MSTTEAQRLRSLKASHTAHHGSDDPRTIEASRDLAAAKLAEAIRATVASDAGIRMPGHSHTGPDLSMPGGR